MADKAQVGMGWRAAGAEPSPGCLEGPGRLRPPWRHLLAFTTTASRSSSEGLAKKNGPIRKVMSRCQCRHAMPIGRPLNCFWPTLRPMLPKKAWRGTFTAELELVSQATLQLAALASPSAAARIQDTLKSRSAAPTGHFTQQCTPLRSSFPSMLVALQRAAVVCARSSLGLAPACGTSGAAAAAVAACGLLQRSFADDASIGGKAEGPPSASSRDSVPPAAAAAAGGGSEGGETAEGTDVCWLAGLAGPVGHPLCG